jgi:threonine/homoserine/homoserine lactone efflux protein
MTAPVELATLLTFAPVALGMNLTPGVDMMFSLGQGLRAGPKSAIAAAAGITAGGMIQATIAGLGLSMAISAHPGVFDAIRWAGVAYLLWLAVQTLRSSTLGQSNAPQLTPWQAFRDGALVNLLNPKIIIFTLALIPQFVDPSRGQILAQFLIFGAVLGAGGMIINSTVGIFASGLGRYVATSTWFARTLGIISASIFALLALRLALLPKL